MKKLLQYVFVLAIIGASGYAIFYYTQNSCSRLLEYSIGQFDPQFGVSKDEFQAELTTAGSVWEQALGRRLFIYNPKADFKINLVYDERQLETIQKQKTEFGLSSAEEIFKKLDTEFNLFKSQYDQKVSSYESELADYKTRKAAFNGSEAERNFLNNEVQKLNAEATDINNQTQALNALLQRRNAEAKNYNQIAASYNQKFGGGLEFNQAEFIGNAFNKTGEINVYQFGNKKDLVLALSHEFGHALGMNHVEDPGSIMYYLTSANTAASLSPSAEDLAELHRVCK